MPFLLAHILTNNGVLTSASQQTAKSAENSEEGRNATQPVGSNNSALMMMGIIESTDKDGIRAIDMAIAHSNEAIVSKLLKRGAKLGPTTWAIAKGKPRIA